MDFLLPLSLRASPSPWQVLASSLLLLTTYFLYHLFLHPLSRYPGPWSARLGLPLWRLSHAIRGDYAPALHSLHERYGPVLRLSRNHLSFSDPAALPTIYPFKTTAPAGADRIRKTTFYRTFDRGRPSLFSERDEEQHSERKRAVAAAYSMVWMQKQERFVDSTIERLVERLGEQCDEEADADGPCRLNLDDWIARYAMDVVGEVAFGESFHLLDRSPRTCEADERFLHGVMNFSQWGAIAGCVPPLAPVLLYLFPRLTGRPNGAEISLRARKLIAKRYASLSSKSADSDASASERQDLLSRFIQARHPGSHALYTADEVLSIASSVIAAGADTTSTAIQATVGFLLSHPAALDRVMEEIDTAPLGAAPLSHAQVCGMDYLQACIKEALRLHPPIGMDLPRIVPRGGAVVAGHPVPAGTAVGVSPYVVHRSSLSFGPDAQQFNPDRWLGTATDRAERERAFFAFGAGKRVCIGKNLALLQMGKVVVELLRRFRLRHAGAQRTEGAPRGASRWFLEIGVSLCRTSQRPNGTKGEELTRFVLRLSVRGSRSLRWR